MMDQDIRTEAAHLASALRAVLSSNIDAIPDLDTGKRGQQGSGQQREPQTAQQAEPQSRQQPVRQGAAAPAQKAIPGPDEGFAATLPTDIAGLREAVAACTRCRLHRTRKNTVFGEGPLNARLMIVGEGAGPVEDETGRPFAGDAGKLLTDIIRAMGLDRDTDCYTANVIKCRIPDDTTPTPEIVSTCRHYLAAQIKIVKPQYLLVMGQTAATTLAGSPSITRLRGRFLMHDDIPMIVTYHPAALLKDPTLKKQVWQDVQLIMEHMKTRK